MGEVLKWIAKHGQSTVEDAQNVINSMAQRLDECSSQHDNQLPDADAEPTADEEKVEARMQQAEKEIYEIEQKYGSNLEQCILEIAKWAERQEWLPNDKTSPGLAEEVESRVQDIKHSMEKFTQERDDKVDRVERLLADQAELHRQTNKEFNDFLASMPQEEREAILGREYRIPGAENLEIIISDEKRREEQMMAFNTKLSEIHVRYAHDLDKLKEETLKLVRREKWNFETDKTHFRDGISLREVTAQVRGILDNVEISDEDFEERIDNPLQEKLFPQEIPLIPSPDWKADVEQEEAIAARERYWKYRRKNNCLWCLQGKDAAKKIKPDPMNVPLLLEFVNINGDILSRRATRFCAKHQRKVARTIKRARNLGFFQRKHGLLVVWNPFEPYPCAPRSPITDYREKQLIANDQSTERKLEFYRRRIEAIEEYMKSRK